MLKRSKRPRVTNKIIEPIATEPVFVENYDLQSANTLAIPATAAYFCEVESRQQLVNALAFAEQKKIESLIVGEGSNLVFANDYQGLVIQNKLLGIHVLEQSVDEILIRVGAGENWHALVEYCVDHGWYGIENLALIPGLAGAAPIQNIGAYGAELKDVLVQLTYIDKASLETTQMSNANCEFAYRQSVFKQRLKNKGVIADLTLRLFPNAKPSLSYPALRDQLPNDASPKQVFDAVCKLRQAKLPAPSQIPNAGSFFKNPIVSSTQLGKLKEQFPGLVSFAFEGDHKIAAAWLIDHRGWKSKSIKGVGVHQDQALVLVNPRRAKGSDVLGFARQIQDDVQNSFGIWLEIEPIVIG